MDSLAIHCQKSSSINGEQDDSRIACIKASSDELISSIATNDALICGDKKRDSLYSITSVCSGAVDFAKADVCGEIEFAIRYNFKFGILEICISACKNLAYGKEEKKKCNPYVKTYLLPDKSPQNKRKTSVKKNTLNPTFQEILKQANAITLNSHTLYELSGSILLVVVESKYEIIIIKTIQDQEVKEQWKYMMAAKNRKSIFKDTATELEKTTGSHNSGGRFVAELLPYLDNLWDFGSRISEANEALWSLSELCGREIRGKGTFGQVLISPTSSPAFDKP
ncbi:hypothetical protein L345_00270, partial [Ophiophagus hannah]